MRWRWIVLLLVPQWISAAPDAPSVRSAHSLIEQCARRADAERRGLQALSDACPQVQSAAKDLGLDAWLAPDWTAQVNARALDDLGALAERYAAPAPTHTPKVTRLREIARALEPEGASLTFWDRIKARITRWLETHLTRWAAWLSPHGSLGPRFWNAIVYLLAATVVLAAVVVVVIELRAARAPGRRSWRGTPARWVPSAAHPGELSPELSEIEAASMRDRPVLVLRLLVGALTRSNRLDRARSLTCRELVTSAKFDGPPQGEQFQRVALLAEQALYDNPEAPLRTSDSSAGAPADLSGVKKLYESLLAMPGDAPPVRP